MSHNNYQGGLLRALLSVLLLSGSISQAGSLSVSPTNLDVPRQGQTTALTIKAGGSGKSQVQIRVFAWNENQAKDKLSKTKDVRVSPQIAELSNRQELTVRILRNAKKKLTRRECYRVLVDSLPRKKSKKNTIDIRIRHSIPLCFNP